MCHDLYSGHAHPSLKALRLCAKRLGFEIKINFEGVPMNDNRILASSEEEVYRLCENHRDKIL